jgi:hypothetical protein
MPTFSGAMQTLRRSAIARASTTLNINQQLGASIGTALMSVLLADALMEIGGLRRAFGAPQAAAEAFGQTFWWALGLVGIAFVVALVLLPKNKPEPVEDPDAPEGQPDEALALAMAG